MRKASAKTPSVPPRYFYRITRLEEALDIGLYDYLDSGCLCLMEWPENVAELLPEDTLHVDIAMTEDGTRVLTWEDEYITPKTI